MDEARCRYSAKSSALTKQDGSPGVRTYRVKSCCFDARLSIAIYIYSGKNSSRKIDDTDTFRTLRGGGVGRGWESKCRLQHAEFQARKYSFEIPTGILSFRFPLFLPSPPLRFFFFFGFLILHRLYHMATSWVIDSVGSLRSKNGRYVHFNRRLPACNLCTRNNFCVVSS